MKMSRLFLVASLVTLFAAGCDPEVVGDLSDLGKAGWCDPTTPGDTCEPVLSCPAIWASSACVDDQGEVAVDAFGLPVARCLTTPDGTHPAYGEMAYGIECVARGQTGVLSHCMPECPPGFAVR